MAAGQQKKRLNSPNYVTCSFQDQCRVKKKRNLESSPNLLSMRGHISLEWVETEKRAVAKREQIGITWRDMAPFVGSVPQAHMDLADVFPIPEEIFELKNLTDVLSYEVWKTHLSENERKVLVQFLPNDKEIDIDQAVRSLLTRESLHFGNPFLIWGDALCSGNLHPDAVLHRERCFKTNKRAYYKELQKYHKDILENLQKLKDKCSGYKDPEKDVIEKMWSCSPKNGGISLMSGVNESSEHDAEENLAGTAESCSWVMDEKGGIVDKENTQGKTVGKPHERKGPMKRKGGNMLVASGKVKAVTNVRKEEMPNKLHILPGTSAKYMSYIKISRKQHDLVKAIKQSGDGIQSKSLNRVLGDIKSFPVQPYETFEEEEKKKLHEYWLQLVSSDLPEAFANRREIQCQRQQLKKSLECEIADRVGSLVGEDEEENDPELSIQKLEDGAERKEHLSVDLQNCKDDYPIPESAASQPLQRIPSLNTHHEIEPVVPYSEDCNQDILKQEIASAHVPDSLKKRGDVEQDTSAKDVWQTVTIPDSYYPPPMSHGYASAAELSLGQPQPVEGQQSRLIDLETDSLERDNGQSLLRGPISEAALHMDSRAHLFPFVNRDRTELLSPFLKEKGMLPSYPRDHMKSIKQHGLEFLSANDCSPENEQFQRQFQEQQQQLFEQRQVRERELYMQQVMRKNMYSNGRYPSQDFFPSVGSQDWPAADPVCTAAFQSPIRTGLLGQNWYSGEQRARNSWSGVEASSTAGQCLGSGHTDGSLFSVLSQCNSLQSQRAYGSMNSDPHIPERNFVSGNVPSSGDILAYSHLNYFGTHEATAMTTTMKENNASWMNLPPNPNSSLHRF